MLASDKLLTTPNILESRKCLIATKLELNHNSNQNLSSEANIPPKSHAKIKLTAEYRKENS
jgi:hypothetical protein